ncbi:MAG: hypothetical protein ACJ8C4_05390 [Gemmataceae bacterium]
MAVITTAETPAADRAWYIAGRREEYEGEGRANLLRIIGITAFYAIELINYYGLNLGVVQMPKVVDRSFHLAMTFLTVAWACLALAVLMCRLQGVFPRWLKFVSTGCDIVLLTTILTLAEGPRSPLVVIYFVIIALAALRFSLPLIWFATAGAGLGYLFLLGFARWGSVPGWPKSDMSLPRHYQAIFLVALILCGVVLGQVIRRMRGFAEIYSQRLSPSHGGSP